MVWFSDVFGHPWENHVNQGGPWKIDEGRFR